MKKLLVLVGLSMIVVLIFASEASATCLFSSASASGSASASPCNDVIYASFPSGPATTSTPPLPGSGGVSPALALGTLALIVGGGLLAFSVVRRR